jgi:hypothetical protein
VKYSSINLGRTMRGTMSKGVAARTLAACLAAALVWIAACDEDNGPHRDYYEYSYIDTVLVGDTIQNGVSAPIVHIYPIGCNKFSRFESWERGDTLVLAVLYHFYYSDRPCAHGSGKMTTDYALHFSGSGARYLYYRRSETVRVLQPVFVEE